jgi:hypothetical protein
MILPSICSSVVGISCTDAIFGTILGLVLVALCVPIMMFVMKVTILRIICVVIGIPLIIIGYVVGNHIVCFSGVALIALAAFGGESK